MKIKGILTLVMAGLLIFAPLTDATAWAKAEGRQDKKSGLVIQKTKFKKNKDNAGFAQTVVSEGQEEQLVPILVRRVKNGAQFVIDSETNEVTLTTPSGNVHTLNLPDSAIANMVKNGEVVEPEEGDEEEVTPSPSPNPSPSPTGEATETESTEEEETEGSEVVTEVSETRYLLGIFPIESVTGVVIDTATGEVIEGEPATLLDWILDKLSI